MVHYRLTYACNIFLLATRCLAGLQAPILIINYSPWDVSVDLDTSGDNCLYYDFDDQTTQRYMTGYNNDDLTTFGNDYVSLNNYLQAYRVRWGIPDLRAGLKGNTGSYTLAGLQPGEPVNFGFQAVEMKGSGSCASSHSVWTFSTTFNSTTTKTWGLNDPPTSNWYITEEPDVNGLTTAIDIGPGGHADLKTVLTEAIVGTLSIVAIASGVGAIAEGLGIAAIRGAGAELFAALGRRYVIIGGLSIAMGGGGLFVATDQTEVSQNNGEPSVTELESTTIRTYTHEPELGETSISQLSLIPIHVHTNRTTRWPHRHI
jgi:hypothetical protein